MRLRPIKKLLVTGAPFGLVMGIFFAWRYGAAYGLIGGFACGFFFAISMANFVERQRMKMESKDASFEGEDVLFQGPANHFLRGEGRGGWLTLTRTRLAFRSHGENLQNRPIDIPIADVREAAPALTVGFVPNGLRIRRKDGGTESFVVSNRKEWARRISAEINAEPIAGGDGGQGAAPQS
jgi:hypothetical protein